MNFNKFTILLCFISINIGSLHAKSIGNAPVKIGRKIYVINTDKELNWFHAAHHCRTLNGDLVTIESDNEMSALSDYLKENGFSDKHFWTSGNDLAEEGNFKSLSNGQTMNYTNFFYNPDNYNNEDCIHIRKYKNNFYMNDLSCDNSMFSICELQQQTSECDNENCIITIPKHILLEVIEAKKNSTNKLNYRE